MCVVHAKLISDFNYLNHGPALFLELDAGNGIDLLGRMGEANNLLYNNGSGFNLYRTKVSLFTTANSKLLWIRHGQKNLRVSDVFVLCL